MVSIPRLKRQQVQTAPLQGVSASPAAFAPEAGVLDVAARTLAAEVDLRDRERQKADEVVINDAEVKLRNAATGVLYDPKKGAMLRQGLDAQKAPDEARAAFRTRASDIEAGLSTPEQKDAFRAIVARHESDLTRQVTAHAGSEFQRVNDETYDALTKSELSDIIGHAADAGWVDAAVSRLRTSTALYADRAGWSPEMVERQVETLTSAARARQVDALANQGSTDRAKTVLADHSADFTAEDKEKAQATVNEAVERQAIGTQANRILTSATTATEAYEMTRTITDPDVRAGVRKVVEAEYAAKEEAQKRDREQSYMVATRAVNDNPGKPVRSVVPVSVWNNLTPEMQVSIGNLAEAPAQNDSTRWMEFYNLSPDARAKLSPVEFQTRYWSHFDTAHRSDAETLYKAATGGGGNSAGSTGTLTDQQQIRSTLVGMHLVSTPVTADWNKADAQLAADFTDEYDRRVRAWAEAHGGKATDADRATIAGDIGVDAARFVEQGTGRVFRGAELAGRLPGVNRQNLVIAYDKIPLFRKQAIERAIRDNGLQPMRDRVERAYSAELRGDSALYDRAVGKRFAPTPTNPDLMQAIDAQRTYRP